MDVAIAADTSQEIVKASSLLGIEKEELVDRAIQVYLDDIKKFLELKQELKVWDQLSDEALAEFERSF
ncbi:MAG: hypothetical protein AABX47_01830 [Nanoarchaeota archaeon]